MARISISNSQFPALTHGALCCRPQSRAENNSPLRRLGAYGVPAAVLRKEPWNGIENVRKRLVLDGFERALNGRNRPQPPTPCKLDGEAEAKLIALRLGQPPAGYGHWTLRLLADELVVLDVVDSISPETVRQTLKKTG